MPREQFVPEPHRVLAFRNGPLPIGHGQTISQPYIVALMTDLMAPHADSVVLEIGTGSGYPVSYTHLDVYKRQILNNAF